MADVMGVVSSRVQDGLVDAIQSCERRCSRLHRFLLNCTPTYSVFLQNSLVRLQHCLFFIYFFTETEYINLKLLDNLIPRTNKDDFSLFLNP